MNKGKVVAIAIVSFVAYTLALGFLSPANSPLYTSNRISSGGTVKAIGVTVYSDAGCTSILSSIDWGVLEPGESKSVNCYILNDGDFGVTLSLSTENWNPSDASNDITLSWDYAGQFIDTGEVVAVRLTLDVSASVSDITDFSFDIVIVGSG